MTDVAKIDCLILAAGGASRFGGCKQLADWQGQPLLAATIASARALKPERMVVVGGAYYAQLSQALGALNTSTPETAIELLEFRAWNLGIGHSLAFAVKHLQNTNPVLVLLADQPLISEQDLRNLYRTWCKQPDKIACASFTNTLGVPAIFPARFKAGLYQCRGDRGAKSLLLECRDQVQPVVMPAAAFDVDTPADLSAHLATHLAAQLKKVTREKPREQKP